MQYLLSVPKTLYAHKPLEESEKIALCMNKNTNTSSLKHPTKYYLRFSMIVAFKSLQYSPSKFTEQPNAVIGAVSLMAFP